MSSALIDNDVLVKPLTSRDLPKVRELHSKILPVQYPASFFLQLLLIPTRACFIAYRRAHPTIPIGFISAAIQQPVSTLKCFTLESQSPEDHPVSSTTPLEPKATLDLNKPRLEILTLGVLPSYQQHGLARRLVQRVVDTLRQSCATNSLDGTLIYANVSTSNTEALKFYERIGMAVSSEVIRGLYRSISYGSKDAYLVVGVM
ncbi:acyl-CoA N-acyltransferase [Flammula alnicola]|nr:acyl-CoA N-acyltransferase [Flammula alnicola]